MDFTTSTYRQLLSALQSSGYSFQTFEQFITEPLDKVVMLRHDVDKLPGNALTMARIEHEMGIAASYYFRAVPVSFDPGVMKEIAGMGHEVGYHYENVDAVLRTARAEGQGLRAKGEKVKRTEDLERLIDLGYEDFCLNLERFREVVDVKTVCMHGSPMSRYDNRMIWEKYDYRELGIIGEPYFDVDFKEVFYVTDTGRRWNHESASVRDRVESGFDIEVRSTGHLIEMLERREKRLVRESARICANENEEGVNISAGYPSSNNFIACGGSGGLPDKIMFNVHPQRWHDAPLPWLKELAGQRVKNLVKAVVVKRRGGRGSANFR